MKFLVEEIQTFADGTVSILPYSYDTRAEAEHQFYTLLAAAVISDLPLHTVVLMTNAGQLLDRKVYNHTGENVLLDIL